MYMEGQNENIQDKKEKLERSKHSPKLVQARSSQRILPKRDHSRDVGFVFVQLAQASPITPKQEVT